MNGQILCTKAKIVCYVENVNFVCTLELIMYSLEKAKVVDCTMSRLVLCNNKVQNHPYNK